MMSKKSIVFQIKRLESPPGGKQTMTFLYPDVDHNILMSYWPTIQDAGNRCYEGCSFDLWLEFSSESSISECTIVLLGINYPEGPK